VHSFRDALRRENLFDAPTDNWVAVQYATKNAQHWGVTYLPKQSRSQRPSGLRTAKGQVNVIIS
jgi:hypothetical protein